jgi:23S rRNA (uracil1939-C5)-methyltransferase
MPFKPTDFTQVNPQINRVMVGWALRLLAPLSSERVIDWFCGLGNFTLPLARLARVVHGIEGSAALVQRAMANAKLNQLADKVSFEARNLFELDAAGLMAQGTAECWLVDPPREGAFALAKALADAVAGHGQAEAFGEDAARWVPPRRIVYVSCNPASLARDAGLLVHQAGYACTHAGIINMFPHTAHVESIAVFDRVDAAPTR